MQRLVGKQAELVCKRRKGFGTPLLAHGIRNALIGAAAFFPAIRARRHPVNLGLTTLNANRWHQTRQVLQPKACGLHLPMAELPGLDDLLRWGNRGANHTDWVLDTPAWDWCGHQQADKIKGFGLLLLLPMKMTAAADGQMGAGRMGNHQIPAVS